MFFEIIREVLYIVWLIITWPFVMIGLSLATAFMWTITKLGLWHMPTFDDPKGHWK